MSNEIPEYMSPLAAREAVGTFDAGARAAQALKGVEMPVIETESTLRQFHCPQHPNSRWLVKGGTPRIAQNPGGHLGVEPMMERRGDVFIRFSSAICSVDEETDPDADDKLDWLEAHSGNAQAHGDYHRERKQDPRMCGAPIGLCREQGPGVDVWSEFKSGQIANARRAATISPEIDVDAFINGQHQTESKKRLSKGVGAQAEATAANDRAAAAERRNGLV